MYFGVQWSFRSPPDWGRPHPELYRDILDEVRHAELLGFESAWVTEHHFLNDGHLPSVMPALGAFAALTTRMRIGAYVMLMPFHNPVRVAEDAAVVDQLSGGRLELAVGTGYRPEEFAGFGIDRSLRGQLQAEGVEIMLRAWADSPLSFHGRHFAFDDVDVRPKPVQRPSIPLYLGGMSLPVLRRAARLPVAGLAGRPPEGLLSEYTAALAEHGRQPTDLKHITSRFVWVDRSHERAWKVAGPAADWVISHYGKWFKSVGLPKWQRSVEEECIIGTPEYVIERLRGFIDEAPHAPLHRLIIHPPLLGLDHAESMRMLETFTEDVAPHFQGSTLIEGRAHG